VRVKRETLQVVSPIMTGWMRSSRCGLDVFSTPGLPTSTIERRVPIEFGVGKAGRQEESGQERLMGCAKVRISVEGCGKKVSGFPFRVQSHSLHFSMTSVTFMV